MSRGAPPEASVRCLLCGISEIQDKLSLHISSCIGRAASANEAHAVDAFHIEVEGFGQGTGALYSLHVLARADTTLADVDRFLKKTWLEPCCGHLSAFRFGTVSFESNPDDELEPPSEAMKDARLSEVLVKGKTFDYEYDFGSTTNLALRVVGSRKAVMKGRAKVQLLAQNDPPKLACRNCGKPATLVCAAGCEAEEALSCRACGTQHACGEDMLSPLVNSPRTGACGYPVLTRPRGRGTWVTAK
jgi:hypothetical protein